MPIIKKYRPYLSEEELKIIQKALNILTESDYRNNLIIRKAIYAIDKTLLTINAGMLTATIRKEPENNLNPENQLQLSPEEIEKEKELIAFRSLSPQKQELENLLEQKKLAQEFGMEMNMADLVRIEELMNLIKPIVIM